jgi:hypothetical protein
MTRKVETEVLLAADKVPASWLRVHDARNAPERRKKDEQSASGISQRDRDKWRYSCRFPTPITPKCSPVRAAKPVCHACRGRSRAHFVGPIFCFMSDSRFANRQFAYKSLCDYTNMRNSLIHVLPLYCVLCSRCGTERHNNFRRREEALGIF